MRDFAQEGIDVCLTRANYRTGHLEISAYLSFPDQAFHQVIQGALDIQGAAIQSNDAVVVITINTFGKHTVKLGDTLLVMLELYRETLSPLDESQRGAGLENLQEKAQEHGLRSYLGGEARAFWRG